MEKFVFEDGGRSESSAFGWDDYTSAEVSVFVSKTIFGFHANAMRGGDDATTCSVRADAKSPACWGFGMSEGILGDGGDDGGFRVFGERVGGEFGDNGTDFDGATEDGLELRWCLRKVTLDNENGRGSGDDGGFWEAGDFEDFGGR